MTATIFPPSIPATLLLAALVLASTIRAHPIPDVPVNTAFEADGEAAIAIELDMRCLDPDPENARYIYYSELKSFTDDERAAIRQDAKDLLAAQVEFEFKPGGKVVPEFEVEFFAKPGAELEQTQDVLFLRARSNVPVPEGAEAYRVHAIDRGALSIHFLNEVNEVPVKRVHVLFPGETSYWLDLNTGSTHEASTGKASQASSGLSRPPAAPASTSPAPQSGWIFIAVAILIAAALSVIFIRRSSARA